MDSLKQVIFVTSYAPGLGSSFQIRMLLFQFLSKTRLSFQLYTGPLVILKNTQWKMEFQTHKDKWKLDTCVCSALQLSWKDWALSDYSLGNLTASPVPYNMDATAFLIMRKRLPQGYCHQAGRSTGKNGTPGVWLSKIRLNYIHFSGPVSPHAKLHTGNYIKVGVEHCSWNLLTKSDGTRSRTLPSIPDLPRVAETGTY